ncbi:hypothetical protein ACIODT_34680 [Streptomyces sp. NPDC088251]|uniref:hypothetical protein n=1 Tax=unclassified Streptomyces TaxID=2593676 RepID=UPI0037FADB9D
MVGLALYAGSALASAFAAGPAEHHAYQGMFLTAAVLTVPLKLAAAAGRARYRNRPGRTGAAPRCRTASGCAGRSSGAADRCRAKSRSPSRNSADVRTRRGAKSAHGSDAPLDAGPWALVRHAFCRNRQDSWSSSS